MTEQSSPIESKKSAGEQFIYFALIGSLAIAAFSIFAHAAEQAWHHVEGSLRK